MSRAVVYEKFGGPGALELRDVPEPHAGRGQVRVRVGAAGLNPMDWGISSRPEAAARFGITVPSGFGSDFAGVVDEVGDGVTGFAVGDRVYGGAMARAVAEFVVLNSPSDPVWHTPEGISDEVASTLPVAGLTAAAAVAAIDPRAGDTVLIGGAAGGVGAFAVQLAKLADARVIGTASESTFEFLRQLGAEPVAYGPGLDDRVRALAPDGVTGANRPIRDRDCRDRARTRRAPPADLHHRRNTQPARWRARDRRHRRDPGRHEAHHGRDPRRRDRRADRREVPDGAHLRRRDAPGRTPCPRQDRDHAVTAKRGRDKTRSAAPTPRDPDSRRWESACFGCASAIQRRR